jgi:CHAT domain-containing protein
VLSACNRGRGAAKIGEAIAGLRTAFLSSGVKTLMASLYEVPDTETAAMMKDFYAAVCQGTPPLEALNNAELATIKKRREAGGAAHPFFWASFVLAGRP